ncbi:MAG: hypothetical protein FJ279_29300, partial [Planctomycetes bacterium]|nr:hypothetical protein [Planctomycetota bacterium]
GDGAGIGAEGSITTVSVTGTAVNGQIASGVGVAPGNIGSVTINGAATDLLVSADDGTGSVGTVQLTSGVQAGGTVALAAAAGVTTVTAGADVAGDITATGNVQDFAANANVGGTVDAAAFDNVLVLGDLTGAIRATVGTIATSLQIGDAPADIFGGTIRTATDLTTQVDVSGSVPLGVTAAIQVDSGDLGDGTPDETVVNIAGEVAGTLVINLLNGDLSDHVTVVGDLNDLTLTGDLEGDIQSTTGSITGTVAVTGSLLGGDILAQRAGESINTVVVTGDMADDSTIQGAGGITTVQFTGDTANVNGLITTTDAGSDIGTVDLDGNFGGTIAPADTITTALDVGNAVGDQFSGVVSVSSDLAIAANIAGTGTASSLLESRSGSLLGTVTVGGDFGGRISAGLGDGRFDAPPSPAVNEVEPNDSAATATYIPLAARAADAFGSITPSWDDDWFSVDFVAGDTVSIAVNTPTSILDPLVILYAPDGVTFLTWDNDSGPGTDALIANYPIAATGRYYVVVWDWAGTGGAYEVDITAPLSGTLADDTVGQTVAQLVVNGQFTGAGADRARILATGYIGAVATTAGAAADGAVQIESGSGNIGVVTLGRPGTLTAYISADAGTVGTVDVAGNLQSQATAGVDWGTGNLEDVVRAQGNITEVAVAGFLDGDVTSDTGTLTTVFQVGSDDPTDYFDGTVTLAVNPTTVTPAFVFDINGDVNSGVFMITGGGSTQPAGQVPAIADLGAIGSRIVDVSGDVNTLLQVGTTDTWTDMVGDVF